MEHRLLSEPNVPQPLCTLTLCLLIMGAFPAVGDAQTVTAQILAFNDRPTPINFTPTMGRPIGLEECEANTPIPIQLMGVPTTASIIDIWTGAESAMCASAAVRSSTTMMQCTHRVSIETGGRTMVSFTLTPTQIFGECGSMAPNTQAVFLLPTTSSMDVSTELAAGRFATVSVIMDTQAPDAPSGGGMAAGDRRIEVPVDENGGGPFYGARAYVDLNGCAGGVASSASLVPGTEPATAWTAENLATAPSAVILDGGALNIPYNGWAAVAVTVLDRARNESVLSDLVCIQRVPVQGFWERYCAERGLTEEACQRRYGSCAMTPGRRSPGPAPLAGLGLLIAALVIARAPMRAQRRR